MGGVGKRRRTRTARYRRRPDRVDRFPACSSLPPTAGRRRDWFPRFPPKGVGTGNQSTRGRGSGSRNQWEPIGNQSQRRATNMTIHPSHRVLRAAFPPIGSNDARATAGHLFRQSRDLLRPWDVTQGHGFDACVDLSSRSARRRGRVVAFPCDPVSNDGPFRCLDQRVYPVVSRDLTVRRFIRGAS